MCPKVISSQLCVESIVLVTAAFAHEAAKTCCLSVTAAKPHKSANVNSECYYIAGVLFFDWDLHLQRHKHHRAVLLYTRPLQRVCSFLAPAH